MLYNQFIGWVKINWHYTARITKSVIYLNACVLVLGDSAEKKTIRFDSIRW